MSLLALPEPNTKRCRVCDDKAIGFNFNGLSCESCKSFFRRNAFQYEKFNCPKTGNCLIDFVTRKCCAKCRLTKCLSIGMKPELIFTRSRKKQTKTGKPDSETVLGLETHQTTPKAKLDSFLSHQIYQELLFKPNTDLENDSESSASTEASWASYFIELNAHEIKLISETDLAGEKASFTADNYTLIGEVEDLIYALNLAELYIRKAITFCKALPAFSALNQNDQLIILKDAFTEIILILCAFAYEREKDGVLVIENEEAKTALLLPVRLLAKTKQHAFVFYARHQLYQANAEFEADPTVRNLILAHRLFRPREGLSCGEFVAYQHTVYRHLLHRYLESKYQNAQKAVEKMAVYEELVKEVTLARRIIEGIFKGDCEPGQLGEVIAEIYDLI